MVVSASAPESAWSRALIASVQRGRERSRPPGFLESRAVVKHDGNHEWQRQRLCSATAPGDMLVEDSDHVAEDAKRHQLVDGALMLEQHVDQRCLPPYIDAEE
jgi:hypothetical protein